MSASFRFIHCADLHLGCALPGLSADDAEFGHRVKEAIFGALENIVRKANDEKVDFVIFSGDIFDNSNETPLTRSIFADALKRIRVPCFISYGNHDYKRRWEASMPLPRNAFVFPPNITNVQFTKKGEPIAMLTGASFSELHTGEDLTRHAVGSDDLFSIGVFHCNLDAASQNDKYAPCKLSDLLSKNIDYWALGHIHKRCIVHENPFVVYPGNTQGRNPKESGEKGAYLVSVDNGKLTTIQFFRTGGIIWKDIEVDISGEEDMNVLVERLQSSDEHAVRLIFKGHGPLDGILRLDPSGLKESIENSTGLKIVSIDVRTAPDIDLNSVSDRKDFISAVLDFGRTIQCLPREDLIDIICSTTTAQTQRAKFEQYSDERLRKAVEDAIYLLIEKMREAER